MNVTLTAQQTDAVMDAGEVRDDCAGRPPIEVATLLAKENHPAFQGWTPPTGQPKPPTIEEVEAFMGQPAEAVPFDAGPRQELAPADRVMKPGEQLAPVPKQPPPALAPDDAYATGDGLDECDSDDFIIPRLQLKQDQTKDTGAGGIAHVPNGQWFTSNDPEGCSETREIAILALQRTRAWLLPYNDDDKAMAVIASVEQRYQLRVPDEHKGPICRSDNRRVPVDQGFGTLRPVCRDCPHAAWTSREIRGGGTKRVKPDCGEGYRFLVRDMATGSPAVFSVRSSAIKPTKNLLTNLKLATTRHRQPMCAFRVVLGSREERNERDDHYYLPTFGRPELIDDADLVAELKAQRDGLSWQSKMERD